MLGRRRTRPKPHDAAGSPLAVACERKTETSMHELKRDVLGAIGGTPIVELRRVIPGGSARVLAKLEFANPTGSMKDRMAKAAIEGAEATGRLGPGGTVVEYTAGTTGVSLALVCAVKGYRLEIVFSDAFADEKRRMMEAFGARITDVISDQKKINESLIKGMIAKAAEISARPGHWYSDQLNNTDAIKGYVPMGEEIWTQTGGRVDAFVHTVGTAHSIHGVAQALRAHRAELRVVAVEPEESAVLSGRPTGSHQIEGIGIGFVPPLWDPHQVDEIQTVTTADAKAMARRLAREEGLFAGTSSGANVVAAIRIAQRLGPGATVVTLMCDSGMRYLSTDVYRRAPAA
jgi:cysteine synthase